MEKKVSETTKTKMSWDDFKEQMRVENNEKALMIIDIMDLCEGKEEAENIDNIDKLIAQYESILTPDIVRNLKKRLRVLKNRSERIVQDNFGALIRYIRESRGITLREMQEMTGVSSSYINRIEKGERKAPSFPVIEKMADALEVDYNTLIRSKSVESCDDELVSLDKYLMTGSYLIDDQPVSLIKKEIIKDIIMSIVKFEWGTDKHLELFSLSQLIDKYKAQ